jgi:hypothetical protein
MRAQEDSGIQEELKTSGINKEKFYRGKKLLQFLWQQVCYGLLGQPEERMLACLQVLLVMLLHKEGSNRELKCWL